MNLVEKVSPWFSPAKLKTVNEDDRVEAYSWDVPLQAEHTKVRANRADVRIINHRHKKLSNDPVNELNLVGQSSE